MGSRSRMVMRRAMPLATPRQTISANLSFFLQSEEPRRSEVQNAKENNKDERFRKGSRHELRSDRIEHPDNDTAPERTADGTHSAQHNDYERAQSEYLTHERIHGIHRK